MPAGMPVASANNSAITPNCAETASPGSRKLSTVLPRETNDGPNFNCATLPNQIAYCS